MTEELIERACRAGLIRASTPRHLDGAWWWGDDFTEEPLVYAEGGWWRSALSGWGHVQEELALETALDWVEARHDEHVLELRRWEDLGPLRDTLLTLGEAAWSAVWAWADAQGQRLVLQDKPCGVCRGHGEPSPGCDGCGLVDEDYDEADEEGGEPFCPECDGSGEDYEDGLGSCRMCDGTGVRPW